MIQASEVDEPPSGSTPPSTLDSTPESTQKSILDSTLEPSLDPARVALLHDRVRMVLVTTTHPGNIGAAARAMKTMGLQHLHLVNPRHFPDPNATAMAVSASDLLDTACVHTSLESALQGTVLAVGLTARRRDLSQPMVSAREAASRTADTLAQGDVAFVFGTEMSGLSNQELECCGLLANIPTNPSYHSLNLAAAVQIVAYELRQAFLGDRPLQAVPQIPARFEDIEAFFVHLEDVVLASGFLDPDHPKKLLTRLRRLFLKAELEQEEVNLLRGLIKSLDPRLARRT